MATLNPAALVASIQGKFGNLVFAHDRNGRIIVRHRPVRKAPITAAEAAGQARLIEANRYVLQVRQRPEIYAAYKAAAAVAGKRACDLARADYLHAPAVHDVDLSDYTGRTDQPIRIRASDDFEVTAVQVGLFSLAGAAYESGLAVPEERGASACWQYLSQTVVAPGSTLLVVVTACDRAGNRTTKTCHHALL
ncbi:MAG: hypothetical protein U1G07_25145 [Verrucomicrobiota bacterium]